MLLALWRDSAHLLLWLIRLIGEWADRRSSDPRPEDIHKRQRAVNHAGLADVVGLGLLAVVPIVFTNILPWPGIYEVRTVQSGISVEQDRNVPSKDQRPGLRDWMKHWVTADFRVPKDFVQGQKLVPAIIIAAEGGASRSAAWVLSVLRMLDEATGGTFTDHVFAISSVSGGALGAATYAEMIASDPNWWTNRDFARGMRDLATGDLLAPSIANMFLPDVLRRQVQWPLGFGGDRATVLEDTFERLWRGKLGAFHAGFGLQRKQIDISFLQLQLKSPANRVTDPARVPLLFMNGTDVGTGRRLITSPLSGMFGEPPVFAAADDLLPVLGADGRGADIRMSTAVTNAARFPFISPAGRFGKNRQLVDGGVFENYGMLTARELAEAMQTTWSEVLQKECPPGVKVCEWPLIVPIIVLISNDDNAVKQKSDFLEPSLRKTPLRLMQASEVACPVAVEQPPRSSDLKVEEIEVDEANLADAATGGRHGLEGVNSLFGLIATRGAHGDGELAQARREFCANVPKMAQAVTYSLPQPDPPSSGQGLAKQPFGDSPPFTLQSVNRFFHFDMPRHIPESGESAPMNWVLNKRACHFLFGSGLTAQFNQDQTQDLENTLVSLGVTMPTRSNVKPHQQDCDGGPVAEVRVKPRSK